MGLPTLPRFSQRESAKYDRRTSLVPQHPTNYVEEALGWLPDLLSRTVWPNEVLADNVLRWILEGVRDVNDNSSTPIILDLDTRIADISARIANPRPNSTGSGDIYGNVIEFAPAGRILGAVQKVSGAITWGLNKAFPKLGDNIQDLLGIRTVMNVLTATTDRRIPGVAADVDAYTVRKGAASVAANARMSDRNEWGKIRYPSKTFENHELWTEVFGDERGMGA
jgi:hypothetical protein